MNYITKLIEEDDIMYQDNLVCILRPEVKKGIIIWTHYTQPWNMDSLGKLGLKTGKQLESEGIYFGRTKIHPYIFFRAPYYSRDIDYSTIETEIISSFGEKQIGRETRVFIRVDPNRSFVFSSEIRVKIPPVYFHISDGHLLSSKELSSTHVDFIMKIDDKRFKNLYNQYYYSEINKSKKTLTNYLNIIKLNKSIPYKVYNLYSSCAVNRTIKYPFDNIPINRNSEILVSIPHLTPDYFVLCT